METILTEIIQLLTGGLTEMATGIGGGLQALVTSIFLETSGDTQTLSVFGGVIVIFAGEVFARVHSNMYFVGGKNRRYCQM